MKAQIKQGVLTVTIPVNDDPQPSASRKTLVVASGHDRQTGCVVDGKPVTIGLNAYIKNPDYVKPDKA